MPRGSGNYVSLPDSNADEHYENDINSNRTASAAAVAVAVPSTAAAAAGAGQNAPRGGAARAAPESSISGASAEARSTNPNFSSASDSRGGPGPASSRGDGNTKSAQQVEDEATPLNPNEDSPAGRAAAAAAAAAAAGTEKAGANSKSNAVIDPTGGLPTAEGVFVGSPIAQTSYSQAPTVSGAWASGAHSGAGIVAGPPSYNAHVASATGGGAGRSAVVVMPGGAQVGGVGVGPGGENRTVILVNTMNTPRFFEWGRQPQPFTCQSCSFSGFSSTTSDPCSNLPVLASACCCLIGLWPCSFIPFLIPDLRDMVHRCPNCCVVLGRSRHFR